MPPPPFLLLYSVQVLGIPPRDFSQISGRGSMPPPPRFSYCTVYKYSEFHQETLVRCLGVDLCPPRFSYCTVYKYSEFHQETLVRCLGVDLCPPPRFSYCTVYKYSEFHQETLVRFLGVDLCPPFSYCTVYKYSEFHQETLVRFLGVDLCPPPPFLLLYSVQVLGIPPRDFSQISGRGSMPPPPRFSYCTVYKYSEFHQETLVRFLGVDLCPPPVSLTVQCTSTRNSTKRL